MTSILFGRLATLALACFITACGSPKAPFSVILLPDTQLYSENNPQYFYDQTRWVSDHIQDENIKFVTHVGDIVQNYDQAESEWEVANGAMGLLDGHVPWGVAVGNHDYDLGENGKPVRKASAFLKWFGPDRFADQKWFRGAHDNGINSYQVFTAGTRSFLIFHLASDVPDEIIRWAKDVLAEHRDLPAIVTTHIYLDDRSQARHSEPYMLGQTGNSGEQIWQKFIRSSPQVFMVLCGHSSTAGGEWYQVSKNDTGQDVFEVLADYQARENGGDGWLRIVRFDEAQGRIWFKTYSPSLDQYESDDNSDFAFSVDFAARL